MVVLRKEYSFLVFSMAPAANKSDHPSDSPVATVDYYVLDTNDSVESSKEVGQNAAKMDSSERPEEVVETADNFVFGRERTVY